MKEQNLNIRYMVAQLSELSQQEQELVNRAKAATSNAYAATSMWEQPCCWATAE